MMNGKSNIKVERGLNTCFFADLSHDITNDLITYKGLPAPIICDYISREASKKIYAEGTEFQIGKIEMVGNTGTYIDCPFHRFENGKDFSELEVDKFVDLEAIVLHAPCEKAKEITVDHFKGMDVRNKAVLIFTGWDKNWNTVNYYENHPYITEGAARYLKDSCVKLVGIDSHNALEALRSVLHFAKPSDVRSP